MAEEKPKMNKRVGGAKGKGRGKGRGRVQHEAKEYEQKILDLSRVTRVTAGGKRMRFRACLVIGDQKGKVGLGLAKGADVAIAVDKAFRQAKKNIIEIAIVNQTLPHAIIRKFGAAKIMLMPAPAGTGLKAGGATRMLLEIGGVANASAKILGSGNKINIAKATMNALRDLRVPVGVKTDKEAATDRVNKKKEDKKAAVKKADQ